MLSIRLPQSMKLGRHGSDDLWISCQAAANYLSLLNSSFSRVNTTPAILLLSASSMLAGKWSYTLRLIAVKIFSRELKLCCFQRCWQTESSLTITLARARALGCRITTSSNQRVMA